MFWNHKNDNEFKCEITDKEFYEESIRLQRKLLSIPTNYSTPPEWGLGKKWEEFEGATRVSFNKGKMTLQKYTGEKWVETNQEEYQELIRLFYMSEDIIN